MNLRLGHVWREIGFQRVDLHLNLGRQLGEVLGVVGLGTLDRLILLGLALLLKRLLSVLLEYPHTLH